MRSAALAGLPRLLRTVQYLRPSQVGWRLRYLLQRRVEAQSWFRLRDRYAFRLDGSEAKPPRPKFLPEPLPAPPDHDPWPELQTGRLTLLHRQLPFAGGEDWCLVGGRTENRLWRYHLHYHGWLADLARSHRITGKDAYLTELRRWLIDWMDVCRLGQQGFAHYPWNSFAIAQRLWHWQEIDQLVPPSFWQHAELPRQRFLESVAAQAEYLSQHMEWDLRGNHLFKDAVGLAAAAEMLDGAAPARWRSQAKDIVLSQVREQILPDGMHFERSPMYHIQVLEDLLALHTLLPDQEARIHLQDACRRMAEPVRWLCHPCGRFPLFNDAADRHVSQPREMLEALTLRHLCLDASAPNGLRHFSDVGLIAWHGNPWTVCFDVGPIGPDYQPGHAHADSLTLEASFDGTPLIVDPGTFCYDDDASRKYDRSTKAHNTICLGDGNSSEVWHIFRVGRRASPSDVSVAERDDGFSASASHNGYAHLGGSPRHRRHVSVSGQASLEIREEITGEGQHRAEGGFLLAPEWQAEVVPSGWILRCDSKRLRIEIHPNQSIEFDVVQRPWHPEFGREIMTQRLIWTGNITLPFRLATLWQRG